MPQRFLDDQFGNFIDALEAGHDEASVKFALLNLTTNSGFDSFAYVDMRSGDNRGYSNYPAGCLEESPDRRNPPRIHRSF
jgi:hypothetical protein